jgi:hypothetical protein
MAIFKNINHVKGAFYQLIKLNSSSSGLIKYFSSKSNKILLLISVIYETKQE